MSHRQQQQQPKQHEKENRDGKDLLSSPPSSSTGTRLLLDIHGQPIVTRSKSMSTGSSLQQQDAAATSSSSSSCNLLAVMVPLPPPQQHLTIPASSCTTSKTLESTMKSCVRSFRDKVHPSNGKTGGANSPISCSVMSPPIGGAVGGGVDNAGFVESTSSASAGFNRWHQPSATLPEQLHNNNNNSNLQTTEEPSSSSSRSKLANLPVVPCASAASITSSTSIQTRRDL